MIRIAAKEDGCGRVYARTKVFVFFDLDFVNVKCRKVDHCRGQDPRKLAVWRKGLLLDRSDTSR